MCANKTIRGLAMADTDAYRRKVFTAMMTSIIYYKVLYSHPDKRAWKRIREQVRIESHELGYE